MKVLAINSSPNSNHGKTALILEPFLEGMKEEGAEIEVINLNQFNIQPCQGCTEDVSFNSKGFCECEDDMQKLYPKLKESDVWVFATPNYFNGMNQTMRNLLDRMEPLFQPYEELINEENNIKNHNGKIVLVSSCALWGMENFEFILNHFMDISRIYSKEFAGALLRPHTFAFSPLMKLESQINNVFSSARDAGKQLVKDGKISDNLQSEVSKELVPRDSFMEEINQMFLKKVFESEKN